MELRCACCYLLATAMLSVGGFPDKVTAQISSDGTLSTTVSTDDAVNFLIEGGERSLDNLFHSFSEFSIPNLGSAYFDNNPDITNIFSRVTGGNISDIQGLIRANGTANLFLINPAGIVFGENASLNVGGSFFATTAESVVFGDGVKFSAVEPQEAPLLTINITPGLQMGANPGSIINRSIADGQGLQLPLGQNLILIGGDIRIEGGQIKTPQGHIGLTALAENESINLNQINNQLQVNIASENLLADIVLVDQALASVSGAVGGTININAQNLALLGDSVIEGGISSESSLETSAGDININVIDSLYLDGSEINNKALFSIANAGNINITTGSLELLNGSQINADAEANGNAGNIDINGDGLLSISGLGGNNRGGAIRAVARPGSTGNGGKINITANAMSILDGGLIAGSTNGPGNAGNLSFNVSGEIFISGIDGTGRSSRITNSTGRGISQGRGNGDAGDINITANSLILSDGGLIRTPTRSSGRSGNVYINVNSLELIDGGQISISSQNSGDSGKIELTATESITIRDAYPISPEEVFPRNLIRTIINEDIPFSGIYADSNANSSGDGGSIQVNTPQLNLLSGAQINVSSDGTGNAGTIIIDVSNLEANRGNITATSLKTGGGNLFLTVDNLLLSNQSLISTSVLDSTGGGGNITINSDFIFARENSDILANAVFGAGGNIKIDTETIFISFDSDIDASSEFGIDGVVEINTPDEENKLAIAQLPANFTDASQQIVGNCSWTRDNTFYVVGRRGIAKTPQEHIEIYQMWSDIRDSSEFESATVIRESSPTQENTIVEANAMIINEDGKVEFVAVVPSNNQNLGQVASSCSGERNPVGT